MTDIKATHAEIWKFLGNLNGGDFVKHIDSTENGGNGDGVLTQNEFVKFLETEGNWTGTGVLTRDLIGSFFNKMDTDRTGGKDINAGNGKKLNSAGALDKDEVEAAIKKIEIYEELTNFTSNIVIPDILTNGQQWKADYLKELNKLAETYINSNIKDYADGALTEYLDKEAPAIYNRLTAEYFAADYQNNLTKSVLKEYPEYKIADDATLKELIDKYITGISTASSEGTTITQLESSDIKEGIKNIIDNYLRTAGIGGDQIVYDSTATEGEEANGGESLNDLQKAVLKQTVTNSIKDSLANDADYKKYKELYNEAIDTFVAENLVGAERKEFTELLDTIVNDWEGSEAKKLCDAKINIDKRFKSIIDSEGQTNDFYDALVQEFGSSIADIIANDGRYIKAYQKILKDVIDKVTSGELDIGDGEDFTAVDNYVIEQIKANLGDFFPNGYGDVEIEDLNTMYDKRAEAATAETDDDKSLKQHRAAALEYCKALVNKHPDYESIVIDAFGENWKTEIGKMYPSEIADRMAELKAAATELTVVEVDRETEVTWSGIPQNISLTGGEEYRTSISASVNGNSDVTDISYAAVVTSGSGNVTIDALGNMAIKAGTTPGYLKIEVQALVNGEKAGKPQEIVIKIESNVRSDIDQSETLKNNKSGCLQGNFRYNSLPTAKTDAITLVTDMVNGLKSGLEKEGYDSKKISYAITTTINYFTALINALYDQSGSGYSDRDDSTGSFTYYDANGTPKTVESYGYRHVQGSNQDNVKTEANKQSKISLMEDMNFLDINSWAISIPRAEVINKFIEFFNAA